MTSNEGDKDLIHSCLPGEFFFFFFVSTLKPNYKQTKSIQKYYKPNKLVGGGSFPLTIGTEERGGGTVGMRPEKDLAAAQCATA
jgi:hypothetical protein